MEFYDYDIVEEIEKALKGEAYIAALALTLTIPDMCCGSDSKREDYIKWFNDYVNPSQSKELISGKECYALRCSFLHQQNGQIRKQKVLKDTKTNITFGIILPTNNNSLKIRFILNYKAEDDSIKNEIASIEAISLIKSIISGYKQFKENNPTYEEKHDDIFIF